MSWELLAGFEPGDRKSVGVAVAVHDADGGGAPRESAEYGGGLVGFKRAGEFAAIRLTKP